VLAPAHSVNVAAGMSVGWQSSERDDGYVVELSGELDISSASSVESRLMELEKLNPGRVILDLTRVSFIDSTGLSMIINADGRARKRGSRLTIVSGEGVPRRILRTVGLEDRLDVLSELPGAGA
jgi:anti-sigma B factor antagonist